MIYLFSSEKNTYYRRTGYKSNICDSLYAQFVTQIWLITAQPSLSARRWVGRQTL